MVAVDDELVGTLDNKAGVIDELLSFSGQSGKKEPQSLHAVVYYGYGKWTWDLVRRTWRRMTGFVCPYASRLLRQKHAS